jgi:hypothetical protein
MEASRKFLSEMVEDRDIVTNVDRNLMKKLVPFDGMLDYVGEDYRNYKIII